MRRRDEGLQEQPGQDRSQEPGAARARRDSRRPRRLCVLRVEAAKALKDFSAKSKGVLEIKGGISDGKAVSADDVKAIAELPTKDQLLGQIAGLISGFARDIAVCVNGVSSGLARSIQQVSEQKAA